MEVVYIHNDGVHFHLHIMPIVHPDVVLEIAQVVKPGEGIPLRRLDDIPLFGQFDAAVHSGLHNLRRRIRLRDKVHGADLEALHLGTLVGCQHDDRNSSQFGFLLHDLQYFHTTHAGHLQIQKDNRDFILVFPDLLQRLSAIRRIQQVVLSLEHIPQHHQVDVLVLHDEDITFFDQNAPAVHHHRGSAGRLLGVIPCHCPKALQELLLLVHQGVRAFKYAVEARVFSLPVIRKPSRDHDSPFGNVFHGTVMQCKDKFFPDNVIPS